MNTMPAQKPGRSEQVVATPVEFLDATKRLLGIRHFAWDLAATEDNAVSDYLFDPAQDALSQDWSDVDGWQWLNPPYSDISPWVERAYHMSQLGARIAVLVPASTGANWWRLWVHQKAAVYLLNGRLIFVGHDKPYPKDCALLIYDRTRLDQDYSVWSWKTGELV